MTRDWDSKPPVSWGDVADLLAEVTQLRAFIRERMGDWPTEDVVEAERLLGIAHIDGSQRES